MKRIILTMLGLLLLVPGVDGVVAREPVIIDHRSTSLEALPLEWVEAAQESLHIGYGHTSHGSQITSGMRALDRHFTDGRFAWGHTAGQGRLHLFEGDGYGDGWLDHDCGYDGWELETAEYLEAHPECNVIMWSWCGQVNSVDVPSHYLTPMVELEEQYPEVTFVYMTGHLEGLGPDGSLHAANQTIREHCLAHGKVLFDFADIEKYDPDQAVDYQELFATDACDYTLPEGGTANWAADWVAAHPDAELAAITRHCDSCAHSHGLNCVQKGIAAWWLWARLAGWDGDQQDPSSAVVPAPWGAVKAEQPSAAGR